MQNKPKIVLRVLRFKCGVRTSKSLVIALLVVSAMWWPLGSLQRSSSGMRWCLDSRKVEPEGYRPGYGASTPFSLAFYQWGLVSGAAFLSIRTPWSERVGVASLVTMCY